MSAIIFDSSKITELTTFIENVAEAILNGQISLFLGAGSSIQYDAMSWDELIDSISGDYPKWKNTEIAQFAELNKIDIKEEICKKIGNLKIDENKRETYLYYLLDFDYQSLWTTNYDSVIEKVLDSKSKKYCSIYKYNHFPNLSFPYDNFLFKINGSYSASDTIVITREDFIDYKKTHEAYLILLKRELLCNNMLFLGCSFDDDILRISIKDILNCIDNSSENYSTEHYAIIVDKDISKLNFISNDLVKHYKINCLKVNNPSKAFLISYGISRSAKYKSIFVSGAKRFVRNSNEENWGKAVCQDLVNAFFKVSNSQYKFISGMGMSIGHFICGTVKDKCNERNSKRFLQMEPFPFTTSEANDKHRNNIIGKCGIFIFIFGDVNKNNFNIEHSGMWKEYKKAKEDSNNIIVPIPCGKNSISYYIYMKEMEYENSFSYNYQNLIDTFNYKKSNQDFFIELAKKVKSTAENNMNGILKDICEQLS